MSRALRTDSKDVGRASLSSDTQSAAGDRQLLIGAIVNQE